MLRMGKNPKADQAEGEHTTDNPATQYNASQQSYQPYQNQQADSQYRPQAETASTSRPVTESESLARDIKEGILSGFVGNGTTLTGEASFKGMLRVDGHLSGQVKSDGGTLIVGNNGQVDADINVAVATIHGTVNGNVTASQRLELGRAAKVKGDIETPTLVIEQGATFEGSCRMIQLREAQDKKTMGAGRGNGVLDTTGIKPTSDTTSSSTAAATDSTAKPAETSKASNAPT
ncbi:MAG: polymer-forming cytoskeletal protein [Pyrinomonadaceae bacterium]|nr:polymer-forming cytoskeletal protein [Pyrinomonadaceae bacterium]